MACQDCARSARRRAPLRLGKGRRVLGVAAHGKAVGRSTWRDYGRKGGRPQSEIRVDLAAALVDGPGTTKDLAQRTGWSIGMTREALNNMVRCGQAVKVEPVRVPGVCRPVPVYARPPVHGADAAMLAGPGALAGVLSAWTRWPSYVTAAVNPLEVPM